MIFLFLTIVTFLALSQKLTNMVLQIPKASTCVFPFIYKGQTYNSCTMTDYSSLWCATTSNYDKDFQWTTCSTQPYGGTWPPPGVLSTCVFPFIYKGQTYNSCTMTDYSSLWCATTSNFDKDFQWTTCSSPHPPKSLPCNLPFWQVPFCPCPCDRSFVAFALLPSSSRHRTSVTEKPKVSTCVFPFIYKGQTYNSCTMTDYSSLWCATTSNFDKDFQWTTSICEDVYSGNSFDSSSCVFPFIYKGQIYNSCTMTDYSIPWCATTSNYDKDFLWTTCSSKYLGNIELRITEKPKASTCVFPFIYKGQTYTSCTMTDYSSLWCATTSNFDKDFQWTTCSSKYLGNVELRSVLKVVIIITMHYIYEAFFNVLNGASESESGGTSTTTSTWMM
uniref:Fibronectin type-II domain-containing protein n=1 Tax=Erpetoichthys calabaricus TaxID=27687 RepID=A0A8C4RS24_ERPCA